MGAPLQQTEELVTRWMNAVPEDQAYSMTYVESRGAAYRGRKDRLAIFVVEATAAPAHVFLQTSKPTAGFQSYGENECVLGCFGSSHGCKIMIGISNETIRETRLAASRAGVFFTTSGGGVPAEGRHPIAQGTLLWGGVAFGSRFQLTQANFS